MSETTALPIATMPPTSAALASSVYTMLGAMVVGGGSLASGASPMTALTIAGLVAVPLAASASLASAARLSLDDQDTLLTPMGTTTLALSIVGGGIALPYWARCSKPRRITAGSVG
ncbi:MAG: hypothetical protein U0165_00750 [Polyangiaceae bacterium]